MWLTSWVASGIRINSLVIEGNVKIASTLTLLHLMTIVGTECFVTDNSDNEFKAHNAWLQTSYLSVFTLWSPIHI